MSEPVDPTLVLLGALPPTDDQRRALRASLRGHATEGQQRMAWDYVLNQLCRVAGSPFQTDERVTSFRCGAQAVGQMVAVLAGVNVGEAVREEVED